MFNRYIGKHNKRKMSNTELLNNLDQLSQDFGRLDSMLVLPEDKKIIDETIKRICEKEDTKYNKMIICSLILLAVTLIFCYL